MACLDPNYGEPCRYAGETCPVDASDADAGGEPQDAGADAGTPDSGASDPDAGNADAGFDAGEDGGSDAGLMTACDAGVFPVFGTLVRAFEHGAGRPGIEDRHASWSEALGELCFVTDAGSIAVACVTRSVAGTFKSGEVRVMPLAVQPSSFIADLELSADGQELYFAMQVSGSQYRIHRSIRDDAGFATSDIVNTSLPVSYALTDPNLSSDGHELYVSANTKDGTIPTLLHYRSVRLSTQDQFMTFNVLPPPLGTDEGLRRSSVSYDGRWMIIDERESPGVFEPKISVRGCDGGWSSLMPLSLPPHPHPNADGGLSDWTGLEWGPDNGLFFYSGDAGESDIFFIPNQSAGAD